MTRALLHAAFIIPSFLSSSSSRCSTIKSPNTSIMLLPPPAFMAAPIKSTTTIATTTTPALQAISDDESSFSDGSSNGCSNDELPKKKSLRHALNLRDDVLPALLISEQQQDCWIVGHRGALYHELENTLAGFQYCLDVGADAIELDVFLISDQHLIVFHGGGTDENPGDLTDYCVGEVNRTIFDCTSLEEVQSLQFNPNCREFGCPARKIRDSAGIPTLQQVLELVKGSSMVVKIELKGPGTVRPVLDLVATMGMQRQCHYSSFDHSQIQLIRELHPEMTNGSGHDGGVLYRTGALFNTVPDDFIQRALAVGATEVHLLYSACTVDRIQQIHEAGMNSMAWFRGPVGMKQDTTETFHTDVGNEDESMYRTVLETGVQQLCCNRPDLLVTMLRKNKDRLE